MIFSAIALAVAAVSLPFASAQVCDTNETILLDQSGAVRVNSGKPRFVSVGAHRAGKIIIDLLPCDPGYSDLWQVNLVIIPPTYPLNTFTSAADVQAAAANSSGVSVNATTILRNCPIVPFGSTAVDIGGSPTATIPTYQNGWYQ
ncbi:hypothetical protein BDK51DRAFT_52343 [Blyttiomyces helicus]|uniref:Phosphatidylglycerol/phosphatidylinositol transfer protein n=1 Tax=Blyttiomyces helicus TaxID=388810 RepID=A0A4P9W3F8_9FUNG|nr:hypothetical protein BDK51DRAFT_52343 [Blyttiomyces helicus]|eukprot:RKO85783.1 hypothetical protein BDK51DRAFT_52343 [Blyttiomyces helicus]